VFTGQAVKVIPPVSRSMAMTLQAAGGKFRTNRFPGITGRIGDGAVRTSACHEDGAAVSRRRSLGPLKTAFPTKSQNPIACQNAAPSTKPRAAQAKDCKCSCRREIADPTGSAWRE
jgi:hypothetical protein